MMLHSHPRCLPAAQPAAAVVGVMLTWTPAAAQRCPAHPHLRCGSLCAPSAAAGRSRAPAGGQQPLLCGMASLSTFEQYRRQFQGSQRISFLAGMEEARIGDACAETHPSKAARAGCRGVPEPVEIHRVAPSLIVHTGILVACHVYVPVLIQPLPALRSPTRTQRKAFWSVQPFEGMRDTGHSNAWQLLGCAPWAALERLCGSPCSPRRWAGRRAGSSAQRGPWAAGAPATHGPSRGTAGSAHSQTPQLPRRLAVSASS